MQPRRIAPWVISLPPIAAALLPLVRSPRCWVQVWDYPRMQLSVLLAGSAVVQVAARPQGGPARALLGVTLGWHAWQVSRIFPYTPLQRQQVPRAGPHDAAHTISLLESNVLQFNRNAEGFLQRVHDCDPDVVFAVETDGWWDAQLSPLFARYPWNVRRPLDNTYGLHLLSRLELRHVEVRNRVEPGIPSVSAEVRLRSGEWVQLHCVHPQPPQVGNDVETRDAELLIVAREAAAHPRPTIVCGDLNDVAWSHTTRLFQRISGLLDPRVGRGLCPTFHADYWFGRWPLDHVFHDASFRLVTLQVLEPFGSDHFPVFITLVHQPDAADVPPADGEDQREADEKIGEGIDAAQSPGKPDA